MAPDAKKKLIGALIAAGLAIAVYYGLIDQKQADSIRTQADQTLGTGPAQQQPPTTQSAPQQGPTTTPNPTPPPQTAPDPQNQAPAPSR